MPLLHGQVYKSKNTSTRFGVKPSSRSVTNSEQHVSLTSGVDIQLIKQVQTISTSISQRQSLSVIYFVKNTGGQQGASFLPVKKKSK